MPLGKGRRKLLPGLGVVFIGAATFWFALPVWFPWALRPLAAWAGARYSSYERLNYSRFALHNLSVTNRSVIVHVRQLEAFVPSVWLWNLAAKRDPASNSFLALTDWDCQVLSHSGTKVSSPFSQIQDIAGVFRVLQKWVPSAALARGAVRSGKTVLVIPKATWSRQGILQAGVQLPAEASGRLLQIRLSQARPFDLQLASTELDLESTIELSTNQLGLDLKGSINWQTNKFQLGAHFGSTNVVPEEAILRGQNFQFPAAIVGLPQYGELGGSILAKWEHGRFTLDLDGTAHPGSGETNLPSVDFDVHARADTNSAFIDKLVVRTPFVEASLSNPVALSFSAPYLSGTANLDVAADLSRQHWAALTGEVAGVLKISTGKGQMPEAQLRITGTNVANAYLKTRIIELAAQCNWPLLELARADVHFDDGSTAMLSGKADLEKKSATEGHFQFAGPLAQRWLPPGYSYATLVVSGSFQGPLDALAHEGRLEADQVASPMLKPLSVRAQWSGEGKNLRDFAVQAASANSSLALRGAIAADAAGAELRLASLSFSTNGAAALELAQPANIKWAPSKPGIGWVLDTTRLHWAGAGGDIGFEGSCQWPDRGAVELAVERFPLELFDGLLKTTLPKADMNHLKASANWTNGPATFQVELSAAGLVRSTQGIEQNSRETPAPNTNKTTLTSSPPLAILATPLKVDLKLRGNAGGILLSNLAVSSPTSAVVAAHGTLPLTVWPSSPTNLVKLETQLPLVLQASIGPESSFWKEMDKWSGVRLQEPNAHLAVSGTWNAPQGQITFGARRVQLAQPKLRQLNLEDLRLSLTLDHQAARLTEGQLLIQGQQFRVSGELPLGAAAWQELREKKLPDWQKGTFSLQIEKTKLAAFEPFFPELLAPQGELNVDLKLLPGARLEGVLVVRDARTRPLGSTAPFRDINVTLRFRDRLLDLENASANLSGATIDLTGQVDLRGTNWLQGEIPPFALALRGTNVPLAREPEYIVRSDLDLKIVKTNDAPPLVRGAAHLRDSFYLSDLSALVPGGVAKPASRPPYFSIDEPLLADWRLAVTVDGVRWLKLRTSLFNGEVSANLHLQGTLEEPVAIGDIKIDSGLVRFPFGSLDVQQGLLTLSSQDPYHPQLLVRASSKQFGYDIRMEVSGAVDNPVIQFTSNPSLSSEQILLMITTGQLPQGTYALTPQQRAETMALFLGRDLLSKLGVADQAQERLTIRSGEEISEQGRPTYHVEYRFAKHWYIVGEYDRFGDFNAGFKWRVYSK